MKKSSAVLSDVGQLENAPSAFIKTKLLHDAISASADIALIIDESGKVVEVVHSDETVITLNLAGWVGRTWSETVTVESKPKLTQLLDDAKSNSQQRWRQVNHPMPDGPDLPVRYIGVPMEFGGLTLVIGREMQSVSHLQQDLVKTQQAMEREYTRLRHAETKYRALFQVTTEPVLVLDAGTYRVVDANPAAIKTLDLTAGQLVGRYLRDWVSSEDQGPLTDLFSSVRRTGNQMSEVVRFKSIEEYECQVNVSLFRQGSNAHLLVRIETNASEIDSESGTSTGNLSEVVSRMPDGFVTTDLDGRIRHANASFLDLAQLPTPRAAEGESLGRWVGRSEYEITTLVSSLMENGTASRFLTIIRGELGTVEEIEVSAVAIPDNRSPCLGFSIRSIESRVDLAPSISTLPGGQSPEDLSNLIGRVSLKEIVREATDVIERMTIQAALEHTGNNRALASEMLGLSRQSLYVKLHRYGINDTTKKLGQKSTSD